MSLPTTLSASLNVAVQMDAWSTVNVQADSTFALMLEAQNRGHSLFHYLPTALTYDRGEILAYGTQARLRRDQDHMADLGPETLANIKDFDVILMRQDPPFDMQYIAATHLLEQVMDEVLVVNNPVEVRNAPEKLLVTQFADFMPPTMISRDAAAIRAFRKAHPDTIIKPLFGNGGAGVFHLKPEDENLSALLETFFATSREPLMIQAYAPEIRQGDKRIILVDGKPVGAMNRLPAQGEARANLHVGGRAEAVELTARDQEVCEALGPLLKERELLFTGIDMIGPYLTEINVTSPTGLQEISRFNGVNLSAQIWDAIEAKA